MEWIISLVGVAVGIVGAYFFTIRSLRYQVIDSQKAKFRVSILPIIKALDDESIYISGLIDKEIDKQEIAFWDLLAQLPINKRNGFYNAWEEYKSPDKEDFPDEPRISYEDPAQRENTVKVLRERLNKLMEYCEIAT